MPPVPAQPGIAPATPQHQASHDSASQEFGEAPGQTLARNPDSPSGQFGIPAQLQAAPAVIQRVPSKEVPDLEEDVVTKINAALTAKDHQKALDIILAALVAKDPATFDKSLLVGKKLYPVGGGDSNTEIGPAFQKWLAEQLAKGPEDIKKDTKACRAYMDGLTVPAQMPDIKINIAKVRFKSASVLYSVVRHEFVHYKQIRQNPMQYIPRSEFPPGYANPSTDAVGHAREVEGYLWEAENMAKTGIASDPQFVWNKFEMLHDYMREAESSMVKPLLARWKTALANLFKVSLGGFLTQAEDLIKTANGQPMDEATFSKMEEIQVYAKDLWGFSGNFRTEEAALKPRYVKLKDYMEAAKEAKAAAKFPAALAEASKAFKSAKSGYDGFNIWRPLFDKWQSLSAKSQTKYAAQFEAAILPIWTGAFDMIDATMQSRFAKDKDDPNLTPMTNALNKLVHRANDCKIPAKTKAAKKVILDKWIKDLGLR